MKQISLIIISTLFIILDSNANTWKVGPTRTYQKPSAVAALVLNGDSIEIDAGTYIADVARWTANNLTLRGIGGLAHLDANNTSLSRKAIWIIGGTNTTVENIEFSNCHDVAALDQNWAGIRMEGTDLTVKNCYFHDNDNGILESNVAGSNIVITYTEFNHNGFGDGYSHNLYIGHCLSLNFSYNYSHLAHIGHELKSRATTNYILYNRISSENGDASYEITLPNGGFAVMMGNMIEQGPNSQNSAIVDYGSEGATNPAPLEFYLINNTIVNDRSAGTFVNAKGASLFKGYNNIFAGPGTKLSGGPTTVDTLNNWKVASVANVGLVNSANIDYHLLSSSLAIDNGAACGTTSVATGSYNLTPTNEYKHKANKASRMTEGTIDIGAYEYNKPTSYSVLNKENTEMYVYVDFYDSSINVFFTNTNCIKDVYIYDMMGKLVAAQEKTASSKISFTKGSLSTGVYIVKANMNGLIISKKIAVQY